MSAFGALKQAGDVVGAVGNFAGQAVPGLNFTLQAVSKREQYYLLLNEIETAKRLAWHLKTLIDSDLTLQNLPPSCNLEPLNASVNALAEYTAKLAAGASITVQMVASPEYYRSIVLRYVSNAQTEFICYQAEMQTYTNLMLDRVLQKQVSPAQKQKPGRAEMLLNDIVQTVQKHYSKCKTASDRFRSATSSRSSCPTCTEREDVDLNAKYLTVTEAYLKTKQPSSLAKLTMGKIAPD